MRSKLMLLMMGGALLLVVAGGCSSEPATERKQSVPLPAAGNLALPLTGTVAESFESGGYNFLRLETAEGEQWAATSIDGIREGDTLSILEGQLMVDFYSRSMDRTFPEIIFASSLGGVETDQAEVQALDNDPAVSGFFADALRNEKPMGGMMGGTGSMGKAPAEIPLSEIKVDKATGENAYRVAELHQQAEKLNGKEVTVRGQVMKVSAQIMGRNWIHLQDGSGELSSNTHNLVVTTEAMPEKGEVVTVKGIFQANKDIGAGYRYAALVENAEIVR